MVLKTLTQSPRYLFDAIPTSKKVFNTRNDNIQIKT